MEERPIAYPPPTQRVGRGGTGLVGGFHMNRPLKLTIGRQFLRPLAQLGG